MSLPHLPTDPGERSRVLGALALIAVGVLGLLASLGVLEGIGGLFGVVLFGGLAVFAASQGRRTGQFFWRAAAYPLLGLAIASVAPNGVGGAAFLASLGVPFFLAWRDDERRWWALIPAGTLFALAATAFLDETRLGASVSGSVFLLGLAATFFALTRLRVAPQPWGVFPAVALALLSLVTLVQVGGWLLPVAFIGAGVWLLWRGGAFPALSKPQATPPAKPAPTPPPFDPSVVVPAAGHAPSPLAEPEGEPHPEHPEVADPDVPESDATADAADATDAAAPRRDGEPPAA